MFLRKMGLNRKRNFGKMAEENWLLKSSENTFKFQKTYRRHRISNICNIQQDGKADRIHQGFLLQVSHTSSC